MKATEILASEHRVIEQVLDCLEKLVARAGKARKIEAEDARSIIEVLRNFADRCHHGKEEVHLFPMMEARGFPRDGGPTGTMLHEHEEGRAFIRAMAASLDDAAAGKKDALAEFRSAAGGYIDLLRAHIQKEDHCLFRMADEAFSAADQKKLLEKFAGVERDVMGPGAHETYLAMANDLAERYGVAKAAAPSGHGCGCHH